MQYILSDDFLWVDETIRYAYSHTRVNELLYIKKFLIDCTSQEHQASSVYNTLNCMRFHGRMFFFPFVTCHAVAYL